MPPLAADSVWGRARSALRGKGLGAVLARGAAAAFVVRALAGLALFGLHLLLARTLGTDEYGIYAYAVSWLAVVVVPGKMGLDTGLLRYVAAYKARSEWGLLRGVLRYSARLVVVFSLATSLAVVLIVWALGDRLEHGLRMAFWIGAGAIPLSSLLCLNRSVMRSLEHIPGGLLPEFVLHPLILATLVGSAAFLCLAGVDGTVAVALHLVSLIGVLQISYLWRRRVLRTETVWAPAETRAGQWLATALPLALMDGFALVSERAGVILVGAMVDTSHAGIYSAASRLAALISWGPMAVVAIAAPVISRLFVQTDARGLQRAVTFAAIGIAVLTVPIAIGLAVAGPWLLGLFGQEFRQGYGVLLVLAGGYFVSALTGPLMQLLAMTGHGREAAWSQAVGAGANIALSVVLIPMIGTVGAAVGAVAGMVCWRALLYICVRRRIDVEPTLLGILRRGTRHKAYGDRSADT